MRLGDSLYKTGDTCEYLYFIKEGEITLTTQNTPILKLSQSQFFGYYEPFISLQLRELGSVVTMDHSVLIRINIDKFNTLNTLYGSPQVLRQVMQMRLAYLEQQIKGIQQAKRVD